MMQRTMSGKEQLKACHQAVERLIAYGAHAGMFVPEDRGYVLNRVLEVLQLESYEPVGLEVIDWNSPEAPTADQLLEPLLDDAVLRGLVPEDTMTQRDLLDSAVMGAMMDRPSAIRATFKAQYDADKVAATDAFYRLNLASNYIRHARNAKNMIWQTPSPYGALDITINLSKPEKDPKEILAERQAVKSAYPMCLLCCQNEGYRGRINHPARQNLRLLPMTLAGEPWYFQYSPYAYYSEHAIALSEAHVPMSMTRKTFERLLDFVQWLPHYFIGSNADLPIVGGSILSHDHFQGGRYEFPMDRAEAVMTFGHPEKPGMTATFLNWPLSVFKLKGPSPEALVTAADEVLQFWKTYSDEENDILAFTDETPHNTITPVARFRNGYYELDLVLRNNRTTDEHPEGLFHPHAFVHPIKKENIGLIEVMGLAVLPGRLKAEMDLMAAALQGKTLEMTEEEAIAKHAPMLEEIRRDDHFATVKNDTEALLTLIKSFVGQRFAQGLTHCGVFKQTSAGHEGLKRFAEGLGWSVV